VIERDRTEMTEKRNDPTHTESDDRAEAEREVERARKSGRDPHHDLTNPASDPDPTEYPDPYERREDPRDPASVDTPASSTENPAEEEDRDVPRDPSTSEPHPPRNREQALREGFEPDQ
jgi:hypothetical protein